LSLFRRSAYIKCHVTILRVHEMCALFRIAAPMDTSGLRAGSPSRANGHIPRAPAAARCVRVLPAFSTQILNYLHHPSVQDQNASNIRAAALRSLRSERPSACYGVLLFEGTPTALLDRFGLTAPNLRTRLRWVEHNIFWINSAFGGFSCSAKKVRAHSRW
jgi:hypothetical protein